MTIDSGPLEAVIERRLQAGMVGARLLVLHRGQAVIDRCFGLARRRPAVPVTTDTLFLLYSASKPYVAMLVHLLAERGLLDLDAPVARHWPGFARGGKQAITIRQVLQHRSGLAVGRDLLAALLTLPNWQRSVSRIESLRPAHPAGAVVAYQPFDFGFILGEVVRRMTGQPVDEVLASELLRPLGLCDTHLGLPASRWARRSEGYSAGGAPELVNGLLFNRRRFRQAVVPAATISATATDVARFYEMLRRGGELDGIRLFRPETVLEARRVSADNERDLTIGWRVRWAQGFHLGGNVEPGEFGQVMGSLSHPDTFGHNGNVCCSAWADPGRELVFVYLTNHLLTVPAGVRHHGEVSDAVIRGAT